MNSVYSPISDDDAPYRDITRYHFETKINDIVVRLVNDYDEADEYIHAHGDIKSILFYHADNISPEDHQSLQMKTVKIQLYSITSNFSPSNFQRISESLYPVYAIVYCTSVLSSFAKLTDEQVKIASSVLNEIHALYEKPLYISPIILQRSESILRRVIPK